MPSHLATFIFLTAFVATATCFSGDSRPGFRLLPGSPREAKGIILRATQLLFLVTLYLCGMPYVDAEIVKVLLSASFFGLLVFGIAFWKSNWKQSLFGFALVGLYGLGAFCYLW